MKKSELRELIKEEMDKILVPRRSSEERIEKQIQVQNKKDKKEIGTGKFKLEIERAQSLLKRYADKKSKGNINVSNIPITSIPDNLTKVGGTLDLNNTRLTSLSNLEYVGRVLNVGHARLTSLPNNPLYVGGSLNLGGSNRFTSITNPIEVVRNFELNYNKKLTSINTKIQVGGHFNLINCKSLTTISGDIDVGKNLRLINTPIKSLSGNIQVGGILHMGHTPKLESLPKGLKIGKHLIIDSDSPLAKNYTNKEIRQMVSKIGGNIYRK